MVKNKPLPILRSLVLALLSLLWLQPQAAQAYDKLYESGRYRVLKSGGECGLEISFYGSDLDKKSAKKLKVKPKNLMGYLMIYRDTRYYAALFSHKRWFTAQPSNIKIYFDKKRYKGLSPAQPKPESDANWRWSFMDPADDTIRKIRKGHSMGVSFQVAGKSYRFNHTLKGSSKAVRALKRCR
uniref:Uncharacterized protein n=1 Tax=Magnetococcus massalia (strain MO-1) TaxID=451514 RepID=A0A1S7LJ61_MAGMO|nr:conserved exported protein of unknown function [Candidatus Magnetococcus massalia]